MWRISNTYTITCNSRQYTVGWDPEAGPNFLGWLSNITSSVDFRNSQLERSQQDGLVTGDTYLAGRSVAIDIALIDSDKDQRAARLRKIGQLAADARVSDAVISWTEDDGSYRQVIGRLVASPALTHQEQSPAKGVQLSFLCRSPLMEGQVFQITAEPGETATAVNAGTATANPIIYIYGGGTAFDLTWGTNTTSLSLGLASGEYVVLDSFNRTVNKNGNQPAYAALSTTSEFPTLPAGSSTDFALTVTGSTGTPRAVIEFRPAWLF